MISNSFHAYLSNKFKNPEEKLLTVIRWNRVNNLIACGTKSGSILILKVQPDPTHPGVSKISVVMTLIQHKCQITALEWNERFNKLASGDKMGKIILWIEREGKWCPQFLNDIEKSSCVGISINGNGEQIGFTFANGKILCGDVGGNIRWTNAMQVNPTLIGWGPTGKDIFIADDESKFYKPTPRGVKHKEYELASTGDEKLIHFSWSKLGKLIFVYDSGHILLMNSEEDTNPISLQIDMVITAAAWSTSGNMFAIACIAETGRCQIRFMTSQGSAIRTINISAQTVSSISFNSDDSQLIVAVDQYIELIQTIPINPWAYVKDTLIYSVPSINSSHQIVYFNRKTSETHFKTITNLIGISGCNDKALLVSYTGKETAFLLCDSNGIPLRSTFISFKPTFSALTDNYAIASVEKSIAIWSLDTNEVKFTRFEDEISAIAARKSTVFIAFKNGELVVYKLPNCDETTRYNLMCIVESVSISSDLTRVSLTDIYGTMSFLDVHSGSVGRHQRKETWWMKWADDSPDLLATLEKQKLYVYRDFEPEEPISSLAHICQFNNLEIIAVDLITLFSKPLQPSTDIFHIYESKPLRDLKLLLQCEDLAVEEITNFISTKSHPRLWLMMAEKSLKERSLQLAERCFVQAQHFPGMQFMKKIMNIGGHLQKGYINWFLKNYEEAEQEFGLAKRHELSVQMYATVGNWDKVSELVSIEDKEMYTRAHLALAHKEYMNGNWKNAAMQYGLAGETEKQINSLFKASDFETVSRLVQSLPSNSPFLKQIGLNYVMIGAHEKAVEAFLKMGDANAAIDACAHLNQWTLAMQLADKYPKIDKRQLMGRYAHNLAERSHISAAINLFVKFNLPQDAARIFLKEGDLALSNRQFLTAKKCYVFASTLFEQVDISTSPEVKVEQHSSWHKAEAIHFLLLAHHQLHSDNWEDAIVTAVRLFSVYSDAIGKETASALLALCGFNAGYLKQCSNGFIFLENSPTISKRKREKFEAMAIRIFGKNPPDDPEDEKYKCTKCKQEIVFPGVQCICGAISTPSIATGRPLSKGAHWKCRRCHHSALKSEITGFKNCPLCHTSIKE